MHDPWTPAPHPPRRWQRDALPVLLRDIRAGSRPLLYACTGSGKSYLLAALVRHVLRTLRPGWRVVVAVPSDALVSQLAADLRVLCDDDDVGVYYGRRKAPARCTVVCVRSLSAYAEHAAAEGQRTALLVADEAHRVEVYEPVIAALAPVRMVGVTATPYLADDGLALWTHVAYQYRIGQAIADGVLCGLRVVRGMGDGSQDVTEAAIAAAREAGVGTVVDCYDIADAERMAAALCDAGIPAAAVHSQVPAKERRARIAASKAGTLHALCQVDMLTEGVDMPWLRALVLRRRRGSAVALVQLVGRILRSRPDKPEAVAYDLLGQLAAPGTLDRDAVLGRLEDAADREARTMTKAEREELELEAVLPLARARDAVRDWSLGVREALRADGLLAPAPPDYGGGVDPDAPAWPSQVREVQERSRSTRWLAPDLRDALRPAVDDPSRLTVGDAAVLLDILRAAARGAWERSRGGTDWRGVTWRLDLPDVPAEALRRLGGRAPA